MQELVSLHVVETGDKIVTDINLHLTFKVCGMEMCIYVFVSVKVFPLQGFWLTI